MKKFPVLTLAASFALAGFLTSCSEDTVDPAPQPPGGGGDSTSVSVGPGESDANDYVVVATTSDVNSIVQTRTLNSGSVTSVNNGVQTGSGTNVPLPSQLQPGQRRRDVVLPHERQRTGRGARRAV